MMKKLAAIVLLGTVQIPFSYAMARDARADEVQALRVPLNRFQASFNAGRTVLPTDVFAADAIVADGFSPFRWVGKSGARRWYRSLWGATPAEQATIAARKQRLTLSDIHDARIEGDRAYLVIPGENAWTEDGKPHFERAQWLITERRIGGKWLITSHAWAIIAAQ